MNSLKKIILLGCLTAFMFACERAENDSFYDDLSWDELRESLNDRQKPGINELEGRNRVKNLGEDELQNVNGVTYKAGYFKAVYNVVDYKLVPILGTDIENSVWTSAWDFLVEVVPNDEVLSYIKMFGVPANSGTANMPVANYKNPRLDEFRFTMGERAAKLDKWYYASTVLHEYGHLVSMNENVCTRGHVPGNKYYFNVHKATATKGKILYNFLERFYTDRMWDIVSDYKTPNTLYDDNPSHFVSKYASTTPLEDFAETFSKYICTDLPKPARTVADKKILFLESHPEMRALRLSIRKKIRNTDRADVLTKPWY